MDQELEGGAQVELVTLYEDILCSFLCKDSSIPPLF